MAAQRQFGYSVNGYGVGDLVAVINEVTEAEIGALLEQYRGAYVIGATQAQQDPLDDLRLVDGVGHCLAHPLVLEAGVQQVESQIGIGVGQVPVPVKGLAEGRVVGLPPVLDRRQAGHVDVPGLQLQEDGGLVGDDPVDDPPDVRAALEVVWVRLQDDLLPGLPLSEPVGAAADGVPVLRRRPEVHARLPGGLQDVAGEDPDAPGQEARRVRLLVGHPVGVAVHHLGAPDLAERFGVGRRRPGVDHVAIGEIHVLRGDLHPVVPLDAFPEVEGDGQLIPGDLPSLGQLPLQPQLFVGADQIGVDQVADLVGGRVAGDVGDEAADVADGGLDQGVAVGRAALARHGFRRRFRAAAGGQGDQG